MIRTKIYLLIVLALLAACSLPEPLGQTPVPTGEPTPADTPLVLPDEMVQRTRVDLAERLEINAGQVEALEVTAVSWPDAALGCPKPGQVYAEVVTPGYRILLEAEGQTYEYRTDEIGTFVLCMDSEAVE